MLSASAVNVTLSSPALVVSSIPVPASNVSISSLLSALIGDCPDTLIVLYDTSTAPPPPPPPVIATVSMLDTLPYPSTVITGAYVVLPYTPAVTPVATRLMVAVLLLPVPPTTLI